MTDAAFRACYAEWKVIKTRAAVQLVFEIPIEQADEAYQALGGMPIAANEVWCGIARLKQEVRSEPPRQEQQPLPTPAGAEDNSLHDSRNPNNRWNPPKRKFDEMSPAQQAGMLCNDEAFRLFLREKHGPVLDVALHDLGFVASHILASKAICDLVGVDRKTEITPANAEWTSLVLAYRLWQREPSVVPA